MRDSKNVITYNGVFVVGQSKEDISDCRGLRDIAMASNFCPKKATISQNSHICDILLLVHSALNPCKLTSVIQLQHMKEKPQKLM